MNFSEHDDELAGTVQETGTDRSVRQLLPDLIASGLKNLQQFQQSVHQQSQRLCCKKCVAPSLIF